MFAESVQVQPPGFGGRGSQLAGRQAHAHVAGQAPVQQGGGVAGLFLQGAGELAYERAKVMSAAERFQPAQAGPGGLQRVEVGRPVKSGPGAVADVGNARLLTAAVDGLGVDVEGRGEVGGHHDDLDAGIGAVDGDVDQIGRFGRLHLPAGSNDQIDGVQLQRQSLGHEVGRSVLGEGGAGKHVARELEGQLANLVRV